MKELSHSQKTLGLFACGAFILLTLLFVGGYLPGYRRFLRADRQLKAAQEERAQAARFLAGRSIDAAFGQETERNQALLRLFPSSAEDVIRILSDEARVHKVLLRSLAASEKATLGASPAGYRIAELPLVCSFSAEYRSLAQYLQALRTRLPVLVAVRALSLESAAGSCTLNGELRFCAYVLSPEEGR